MAMRFAPARPPNSHVARVETWYVSRPVWYTPELLAQPASTTNKMNEQARFIMGNFAQHICKYRQIAPTFDRVARIICSEFKSNLVCAAGQWGKTLAPKAVAPRGYQGSNL